MSLLDSDPPRQKGCLTVKSLAMANKGSMQAGKWFIGLSNTREVLVNQGMLD